MDYETLLESTRRWEDTDWISHFGWTLNFELWTFPLNWVVRTKGTKSELVGLLLFSVFPSVAWTVNTNLTNPGNACCPRWGCGGRRRSVAACRLSRCFYVSCSFMHPHERCAGCPRSWFLLGQDTKFRNASVVWMSCLTCSWDPGVARSNQQRWVS